MIAVCWFLSTVNCSLQLLVAAFGRLYRGSRAKTAAGNRPAQCGIMRPDAARQPHDRLQPHTARHGSRLHCAGHSRALILVALYPAEYVATANVGSLACCYLNQLAAEVGWHRHNLAPLGLYVTEGVALLVVLSDERLEARSALAGAAKLVIQVSAQRGHYGIGLGMLQGSQLLGRQL